MEDQTTRRYKRSMIGRLYKILGLKKRASPEEVRKAYREMALRHHPDKNPDNPEAAGKFMEINNAYSVLSDENKRKIYDEQLTEERAKRSDLMQSKCWFKSLTVFCCFCCCCCFGFCCNCCCRWCGKFKTNDEMHDHLEGL